ncbi:MAG TPA: tetratricopeptide repeat protein, partial [Methylomirabilota bacterium]|nr:tetratricopeptide repeat protein [Methylomirabilota bacterium]
LEQYAKAFRLLSRLPADEVVPEFRETLLTRFATHLVGVKAFARVIEVLGSRLAREGGGLTASMHFLLGLAHLELKQHAEAAEQMRQCLRKRGEPVFSPVHREVRGAAPRHCLAVALAALQQPAAAEAEFRQALADDPKSRPARFDYARFLAGQGREVEALKRLHELVSEKPDEPAVWHLGGRIALSRPEFLEVARDWTAEASRHLADHPALLEQRGRALLLSGAVEEALPLWRRLASPAHASAAAAVVICETVLDAALRPPAPLPEAVSTELLKWYRDLIRFGAEQVVLKLNERLDRLEAVVPMAAARMRSAIAAAA